METGKVIKNGIQTSKICLDFQKNTNILYIDKEATTSRACDYGNW